MQQLSLLPLPKVDGEQPVGTRLKINKLAPERMNQMRMGETVAMLVIGQVEPPSFVNDEKRGLLRVHTVSMEHAYELDRWEDPEVERFVNNVMENHKKAMAELEGDDTLDSAEPSADELKAQEDAAKEQEAAADAS